MPRKYKKSINRNRPDSGFRQVEAFRKLARELGGDDTEAAFDNAIGKLGRTEAKAAPKRKSRA